MRLGVRFLTLTPELRRKFQELLGLEPSDPRYRALYDEMKRELSEEDKHFLNEFPPPIRGAEDEFYFPGHIHVSRELMEKERYRTISNPETEKEDIYYYNAQIYERGEEHIRATAQQIYLRLWKEMMDKCRSGDKKFLSKLEGRLKNAIHQGPSKNEINEVLADIRRATYVNIGEMNPVSHIPLLNGLVNLGTRKLEPFSPDYFFTYQVQSNFVERHVTLLDTPKFDYYLNSVYYSTDIPVILSYGGYSLQPGFPVHKVLGIVGRERIGKGVYPRILKLFLRKGYGSISWEKLMIYDNRFAFQSVVGKNLLVDAEMRRTYRKGFQPDYANFNKLFGKDVIDVEQKGENSTDYVSSAKGLFIGNLPIPQMDNPAAMSRFQLVRTKDKRNTPRIPDLERDIFASEGDLIAKLMIQCYWGLEDRQFTFPGELTDESVQELWELLADPIVNFIEEMTEYVEGAESEVNETYEAFDKWCTGNGIPTPGKHTFTSRFGWTYRKRRAGPRRNRYYAFQNCELISEVEPRTQDNLDTGDATSQAKKNRAFWNRFKRVQFRSYSENYYEKRPENQANKETAPEMDTGGLGDNTQENAESPGTQGGDQSEGYATRF